MASRPSQYVRIQLQEYRDGQFVSSKQVRVVDAPPIEDLLSRIQRVVTPRPVKPRPPARVGPRPRRTLSEESKAKIAASQKLRWETRSRTISAEVREKISAAQKRRWAQRQGAPDEPEIQVELSEADISRIEAEAERARVALAEVESARKAFPGLKDYVAARRSTMPTPQY